MLLMQRISHFYYKVQKMEGAEQAIYDAYNTGCTVSQDIEVICLGNIYNSEERTSNDILQTETTPEHV